MEEGNRKGRQEEKGKREGWGRKSSWWELYTPLLKMKVFLIQLSKVEMSMQNCFKDVNYADVKYVV